LYVELSNNIINILWIRSNVECTVVAILNLIVAYNAFSNLPHSSYGIGWSGLGVFSTNIHWNWNFFTYFWKVNKWRSSHSVTFNIQLVTSIIILPKLILKFKLAQMKKHFGWGWLVWSFARNLAPEIRVIFIFGHSSYRDNITYWWEYLAESWLTDLLIPRRTKDLVYLEQGQHVSDFRNSWRNGFH